MSFKQVIELADLLDDGRVTGEDVVKYVTAEGNVKATCTTVTGAKGSTDFVKFLIPGKNGKTKGGTAPTLGIVGRLGGLGARPERIGFTSDGDGALAASAIAAKLARMTVRGDELEGDVDSSRPTPTERCRQGRVPVRSQRFGSDQSLDTSTESIFVKRY